jgi:hypothetical protein
LKILGWTAVLVAAMAAMFVLIARPFGGTEPDTSQASAFIVLAGQSNALGFGLGADDLPATARAPDPRAMIWDGAAFVTMRPGANTGSPGAPHAWGPEVEFARRWLADHPAGRLYVLKHARGSTPLAADAAHPDWAPASQELFAETTAQISRAKAALAARGVRPEIGAVLWMQGEADAVDVAKAPSYEANLVELFARIRRDWGEARTPIVFGQINGRSGFVHGDRVRAAQLRVDRADGAAASASTDHLGLQPDRVHFSSAGQIRLGGDFYEIYANAPPPLR